MKQAWVLAPFIWLSCARNVPQDSATGPDGRIKGALPITLDNGEGIAKGIVTYPGGDRVDWRSIELPTGKRGTLDLKLSWRTPRPGLRVAFDVFDQWSTPIAVEKASLHGKGRNRETRIDHAMGTYFVRVFAPRRGDAGAYKLVASFQEDPPIITTKVDVPDPPRLAAVPLPKEECLQWDAHNTECNHACPDDAPPHWRGCTDTCRTPDANDPACVHSMKCVAADTRVDDCMRNQTSWWKACDFANPDPTNPRCNAPAPPVAAKIILVEEQGDDVIVTISAGSANHIGGDWKVTVLSGSTDTPLVGGTAKVLRVGKQQTTARLHLKRDQIDRNQNVRLSPP